MNTTGIKHVRHMVETYRPARKVEAACLRLLLRRPATAAEHAELLCHYAEAMVHERRERIAEAAELAHEASSLAASDKDFAWATRAAILRIELLFTSDGILRLESLASDVDELRSRFLMEWFHQLEDTTRRTLFRRINALEGRIRANMSTPNAPAVQN